MAWGQCEDCPIMERRTTEGKQEQKYCPARGKYCVGPEPKKLNCTRNKGLLARFWDQIKKLAG